MVNWRALIMEQHGLAVFLRQGTGQSSAYSIHLQRTGEGDWRQWDDPSMEVGREASGRCCLPLPITKN